MDGSGMGQDHLDDADVDAERHGPGTLIRTLATVLDQLMAIEVADLLLAEIVLQHCKCRRLASSGWFPNGTHVGYMQVHEVTERVEAGHG